MPLASEALQGLHGASDVRDLIHPAAGDERTTPGVQDGTQEHRQPITPRGASKIPLTIAPLLSQTSRDYEFPKRASPLPAPRFPAAAKRKA